MPASSALPHLSPCKGAVILDQARPWRSPALSSNAVTAWAVGDRSGGSIASALLMATVCLMALHREVGPPTAAKWRSTKPRYLTAWRCAKRTGTAMQAFILRLSQRSVCARSFGFHRWNPGTVRAATECGRARWPDEVRALDCRVPCAH
jgi:hypothetical protein